MRPVMSRLAPLLCVPLTVAAQQVGRIKVERATELPRHAYPVSTTVTELFQNDQQFGAFAQQVEAGLRADLSKYEIRDHATLKSYYGMLSDLALERADYETAVAYQDSMRAVEDKPGLRLTTGIVERALATAARAPGQAPDTARFRNAFRGEIASVPYWQAQVELAAMKNRFEVRTANRALVIVQTRIEPNAANGTLTRELAQQLVAMRVVVDRLVPVREVVIAELAATIASHNAKADVWAARDVSLDGRTDLTPVTMAIWDSGVDVDVYPGQLFTNPGEIADNGKDDDHNGYIDDVHGIAYDIERGRVTGMLQPVSLTPAELIEARDWFKGMMDAVAGLNTPEADALRRQRPAMSAEAAELRAQKNREYLGYMHGTHVAGIAVRGNPAARILVARRSVGMAKQQFEEPPTVARARAFAQEFRESIEYFRQHGVRVVNMSWGVHPGAYETNLAAKNIGTPEERRKLARQIFDVVATGLRDAMAGAPNILFVAAAGNEDADVDFNETVPASFDLPNLITVGAVDAGGDETSFTSYGKVDVYANGYHVLSKVPGGFTIPAQGTSMASPQVVNVAAKLLAVKPSLTIAELRRAILESADEKTIGEGKRIRLLNPKVAVARIGGPGW